MTDTAEGTPQPGQGQQSDPTPAAQPPAPAAQTPAPPPAAPPAAPAGAAPWANDLAAIFTDESIRGTVDQFLRDKVQPYTTQLEQKAAVNEQASQLWSALESDPVNTYVQMTYELYGDQAGEAVLQQLQQVLNTVEQQPAGQQPAPQGDPNDPIHQWAENKMLEEQYDAELSRITGDPNNGDIVESLFHPFVAAAQGDFDQAVQLYREHYAQWNQHYSPTEQTTPPPAPNVLGSDSGGAAPSTTPVEPKKQSLDEALDDFMREQREARVAPPVGPA